MKQPLHRKKLRLALQALGSDEDDLRGKLDHNWVTSECDALQHTRTCTHALTHSELRSEAVRLCFRVAGRHRPAAVQESL